MIADRLDRYYEAYRADTRWIIERSVPIDKREVAWMKFEGTVQYDITGRGREGEPYEGHKLKCECDFTEGVGWRIDERGQPVGIGVGDCIHKQVANYLRQLELRREYEASRLPEVDLEAVISDLAQRVERGEWIGETGGGASFYGGWFYQQTVAAILDLPPNFMWEKLYELAHERKIGLDGSVITPYREPPPEQWVLDVSADDDGWAKRAYLPGNRAMPRAWKLEVIRPDGEPAYGSIPLLPLFHEYMFGPDVEDVSRAMGRLDELLAAAREGEAS